MSRRAALSEVSESGFTDCSSRLVTGQATLISRNHLLFTEHIPPLLKEGSLIRFERV